MDEEPVPAAMRDPRTYAIIGAAMEVHRELGPGFLEKVYHAALEREFRMRGIAAVREPSMPVLYKGAPLGVPYNPDFVCFDEVVVELKALRAVGDIEDAQVIHYLRAGNLETGLLLNFGEPSLHYQRFVNSIRVPRQSAKSAQSAVALA